MKNRSFRAIAAFLLLLNAPVRSSGQIVSTTVLAQYRYNLNSTTEIFCSLGNEVTVSNKVQDATSTTMTAVSGTPFDGAAVGAFIRGTDQPASGGETYANSIVAKASGASITINTALSGEVNPTLTSATFFYRLLTCGTGVNSGAIQTTKYGRITVQIDITQMVLGTPGVSSIDTRILCRAGTNAQWLQVYPVLLPGDVGPTYVSNVSVSGWAITLSETWDSCRIGMKINAADDGTDTGVNAEQVTVSMKGSAVQ